MNPEMRALPVHSVRESRRAKHVHLRFSLRGGLEVVVPPGFDRAEIPSLLRAKERWIARVGRELDDQRALLDPRPPDLLPEKIELRAISETWTVCAVTSGAARVVVREGEERQLRVLGSLKEPAAWRPALRRWAARKARFHLAAWAESEARRHRLRCGKVAIRWQKHRWGSCSRKSDGSGAGAEVTLSLNAALVFLPERLARYVVLHELCHTQHMDHSPAFWKRLERIEPAAGELRDELRSAWQYVPSWIEPRGTPP